MLASCSSQSTSGLSPRLRGNLIRPRQIGLCHSRLWVYPRACGGTRSHDSAGIRSSRCGLSPRLRGNPESYPAPFDPYGKVYPRACGGTALDLASILPTGSISTDGLSPRLRGNRADISAVRCIHRTGSIPAPAGEPLTDQSLCRTECPGGLSPRLRGNLPVMALAVTQRSIPAPAGEPTATRSTCSPIDGLSPRLRGNLDTTA